jgi:hypothetical protein
VLLLSGNGGGLCLVVAEIVGCSSNHGCILLALCSLYAYQLRIVMFINISNVCLRAYIIKKIKIKNRVSSTIKDHDIMPRDHMATQSKIATWRL